MSAMQRMRELLETALAKATTRQEERAIGRSIVELQEQIDFRECAELQTAPPAPEISLPPVAERRAVPPITTAGR